MELKDIKTVHQYFIRETLVTTVEKKYKTTFFLKDAIMYKIEDILFVMQHKIPLTQETIVLFKLKIIEFNDETKYRYLVYNSNDHNFNSTEFLERILKEYYDMMFLGYYKDLEQLEMTVFQYQYKEKIV